MDANDSFHDFMLHVGLYSRYAAYPWRKHGRKKIAGRGGLRHGFRQICCVRS